jgi:hypothetical protein
MTPMRFAAVLLVLFGFIAPFAHAQKTPEDLLEEINRLPSADRQRRLEDGARKEREVVWYSTMNREDSLDIIRVRERLSVPQSQLHHRRRPEDNESYDLLAAMLDYYGESEGKRMAENLGNRSRVFAAAPLWLANWSPPANSR